MNVVQWSESAICDSITGKKPSFFLKPLANLKEAIDDQTIYQIGKKNVQDHMKKNNNFNEIYQFHKIWHEGYPNVGRYLEEIGMISTIHL